MLVYAFSFSSFQPIWIFGRRFGEGSIGRIAKHGHAGQQISVYIYLCYFFSVIERGVLIDGFGLGYVRKGNDAK